MVLTSGSVYDRIRTTVQTTASAGFYKLSFRAMSTECRVHFRSLSPAGARDFQNDLVRWVAGFEARYSRFIPESIISRINAAAGSSWVELDTETDRLFTLCQELYFFTCGTFDPTTLPLIRLWNWKSEPAVFPEAAAVKAAMELVGWRKLQRRPGAIFLPRAGMGLDLGGIGKEYAVDQVTQMALPRGIENILVDFGQDLRVHGQPPEKGAWHIGLEDPKNPGKCWAGVAVTDHAVASSGDYLRGFTSQGRRYGHILDPRSGYPVDNGCRAVTVIAPSCTVAGILSTTAFILGVQEGLKLIGSSYGAEGSITTDHKRYETKAFSRYVAS